jgi:hypothetical protein
MSASPRFQVDGDWFPTFASAELGENDESPIEEAQRIAHLREAKARDAFKFRCPACGELGAMRPGNDRYHVEVCPKLGGAA